MIMLLLSEEQARATLSALMRTKGLLAKDKEEESVKVYKALAQVIEKLVEENNLLRREKAAKAMRGIEKNWLKKDWLKKAIKNDRERIR